MMKVPANQIGEAGDLEAERERLRQDAEAARQAMLAGLRERGMPVPPYVPKHKPGEKAE